MFEYVKYVLWGEPNRKRTVWLLITFLILIVYLLETNKGPECTFYWDETIYGYVEVCV